MGGPALHVSYLTEGLGRRGYATTLVAGSLAPGESSMSFVAEDLGVDVHAVSELHREISPLYDSLSVAHIVRMIKRLRPQILHTHTAKAGAIGRVAGVLAGEARPPIAPALAVWVWRICGRSRLIIRTMRATDSGS